MQREYEYDIPRYKSLDDYTAYDLMEMDDEEFEFRFGSSKDSDIEENALMYTAGIPRNSLRDVSLDDLPEIELPIHNTDTGSTQETDAQTNATDSKHENIADIVNKAESKIKNTIAENVNKAMDMKKKLAKPASKPNTPGQSFETLDLRKKAYLEALEAGKQFNNYIRSILIGKGKFQRTHINLLKKAVDRKTKDKAVKVGTQEWVDIVKEFFPEAPVTAVYNNHTNTEGNNSDNKGGYTEDIKVENNSSSSENSEEATNKVVNKGESTENKGEEKSNTTADKASDTVKNEPADSGKESTPDSEAKKVDVSEDVKGGVDTMIKGFSNIKPTQLLDAYNQKVDASKQALEVDVKKANDSLPEMKAPTGLEPATDTKKPSDEKPPEIPSAPASFKAEARQSQPVSMPDSTASLNGFNVQQEQAVTNIQEQDAEAAAQEAMAGEAVAQVRLETEKIPGNIGSAPAVPSDGAANPDINGDTAAEAREHSEAAAKQAAAYANGDFGEANILPAADDTILKAEKEITVSEVTAKRQDMEVPVIPGELVAEVDLAMGTKLQPGITKEQEQFQAQSEAKQQESDKALDDSDKEISALQDEAAEAQKAEKEKVGSEIAAQKDEYRKEVDQLKHDFEKDVEQKSAETDAEIAAEKQKGEAEAQAHYAEAEQKAAQEKAKAEAEAEKEKDKKKNEKKGFWGKVKGAVTAVVNAVKDAVNTIFDGLRSLVKGIFEAAKKLAMAAIDAATKVVTGLIKLFGEVLKGLVTVLFAAFPGIQEKLLGAIDKAVNRALDAVNKLAEGLKKAVTAVLDALATIIDTLLSVVQELYNIAFTAIGMLIKGEFGEMLKYIFTAGVKLVFGALKSFLAILGIDTATLDKIIEDPIGFFKNLVEAIKGGLKQFVDNFKKHLMNGLAGWLFGTMGDIGIEVPTSLNLKGILKLVLQILNLTWTNIRKKIVKQLGPKGEAIMERVEQVVSFVSAFATGGIDAIIEMVKDMAGSIKETFIGGIIEWVRNTIIVQAITKLVMMFNPVGAIVQMVDAMIKIVMFLKERWEQIKSFCEAVMSSITEIAFGRIDSAKDWVENSLGRFVPIAISFLARLIGLGGITNKIRDIIKKIRRPIDKAVNTLITKVVNTAKKLGSGGKGKGKKGDANKIKEENKSEKDVKADNDDKKLHKEIGQKVKADLQKPEKEEKEDFAAFHKRMKKKGEAIEDKYQPKLKKGINLDVKFKDVKEDEKDGDIDIKVSIKPNDYNDKVTKEVGKEDESDINASTLDSNKISKNEKVQVDEAEEKNRGEKVVGFKGKDSSNKTVITVGAPDGNKYTKRIDEKGTHSEQFNKLKPLSPENRRKIIKTNVAHNKFKPVEIEETILKDGKKEITYIYAEGKRQFKVLIDENGFPESIQGDNLTLHDLGRGITQNPEGKVENSGHDAAHLIANMFGGSGYKDAQNLVTTSSWYNRTRMKQEEDKIAEWIDENKEAHHFSMKVDVTYLKADEKVDINSIMDAIKENIKDKEERDELLKDPVALQEQIDKKLKESGQDRVKSVKYMVALLTKENKLITGNTFEIKEADLLFGTKK